MSDTINIHITRDDSIPAFAAYCSPSIKEEDAGLVLLNIAATFCSVAEYPDDIGAKEVLIESIMHEVGHALEEYLGLEFDEERIEKIVEQYRVKYGIVPTTIGPSDACVE